MARPRTLGAALVLSIAAAIVLAILWRGAERRAERATERAERAERLSVEPVHQRVLLDAAEIARLRKLGLENPVAAVRADLASRQDLLASYPGVLGGTMAFHDQDGMVLLPGGYVYASGDDGHYLVHALLRYDVKPGGTIDWKLIDARRD